MENCRTRVNTVCLMRLTFYWFDIPFMRLNIRICLRSYEMAFAYSMFDSSLRFITFLVIIFVEHISHQIFFLIHYILKFQSSSSFHYLAIWIYLALFRSIAHLIWNYCYCFVLIRVLFNKWTELTKPWSCVNQAIYNLSTMQRNFKIW